MTDNAHLEAITVWMQKAYANRPEDMAEFARYLAELDGFDLDLLLFTQR